MGLADEFAATFKAATKDLAAEKKRREKDARTARRQAVTPKSGGRLWTLKDAVFAVMRAAIAATSGNGTLPFPTRNLYYAVRPRIQQYTSAELKGPYFSQTLVVEWERIYGPIPGHYRDPRGNLTEPHTGKRVPLGTREVAGYELPEHVFDKILYVEKEGLDPIFEAAHLGARYDMAIAAGKGQPTEAVRALFERAEAGEYRLFVLHDADHSGYSIAHTIAEETARMPDYSVEVVDLGLTVDAAIEHDLPQETYTRKVELPWWMPSQLNERETEWFGGMRLTSHYAARQQWECTRVELNALTAPDLIAYIEAGLAAHNADDKIVPSADVLDREAAGKHRSALAGFIDTFIAERFDTDALADALAAEFPLNDATDLTAVIEEAHEADRAVWWKTAIEDEVDEQVEQHDEQLRARLDALLTERPGGAS
jgi:hypothetical protein